MTSRDGSRVLWEGRVLPHLNEADEGVAVDALVTNRIWVAMGLDPATTLHDVRWGADYDFQFVWVFEISGSVAPSHFAIGYADAVGWRQNPVYFPLGGFTIKGVSKPGEVIWSGVFVMDGALHLDLGRSSISRAKRPSGAGRRRTPTGRSCMRCCRARGDRAPVRGHGFPW